MNQKGKSFEKVSKRGRIKRFGKHRETGKIVRSEWLFGRSTANMVRFVHTRDYLRFNELSKRYIGAIRCSQAPSIFS